jgi:hypothetical protein
LEDADTGATVETFFIRSGESVSTKVPLGAFVLHYATGRSWCRELQLFGPDTGTFKADTVLDFERQETADGYSILGHTIELIAQRNGNLATETIAREKF